MANTFNPKTGTYVIDTSYNEENPLAGFDGPVKVKHVRWVGATTAGHEVVITNFNDTDEIWRSVADGDNYIDEILVEDWWKDGFKVSIDSGLLFIDLR